MKVHKNISSPIRLPRSALSFIKSSFFEHTGICLCLSLLILVTPGMAQQTPEKEISDTVEIFCPQLVRINRENPLPPDQKDVLDRCGEVKIRSEEGFSSLSEAQVEGLRHMTSEETSAMGTMSVEITYAQAAAISGRLVTLRGIGTAGLASGFDYRRMDPPLFAGPVTYYAAADDSGMQSIFQMGRLGAFLNGSFTTGDRDETSFEPGFDFDNWGMTAGVDYRLMENLVLGLALGYSDTETELDDSAGDIDSDGYAVSLYGIYNIDALYLDAIATYGSQDYDTVRNVRYTVDVPVDQTFLGDSDSDEYSVSLGAGYDFNQRGFTYGPYLQFNYLKTEIDGYTERLARINSDPGSGLALTFDDQNIESFTSVVGGQASYAVGTGFGVLRPQIRLDWEHEYSNDQRLIKARFLNVPDDPVAVANNLILIPTEDPDRDFFNLGLGVSATLPRGIMAFVDYATILGLEDIDLHQIAGGLRLEF